MVNIRNQVKDKQVKDEDKGTINNLTKLSEKNSLPTSISSPRPPIVLPSAEGNDFQLPISRWTTLGGLFMVVAVGTAIALAGFTQYNSTLRAQAVVRPAGELRLVQALTEGQVKQISVQQNQPVKKGDVIATLDDSRLQTRKSQLQSQVQQARLQLAQINAQIHALDRQIWAETNRSQRIVAAAQTEFFLRQREYRDRQITTTTEIEEARANLSSSEKEWQRAQAQLKSAEADFRSAEAALNAASARQARYQKVAKQGALSLEQLEEAELAVEQQKQTLEGKKATLEAHKQTIEQLQQAIKVAQARLKRAQIALNPSPAEVAIAYERIAQEKATGEATSANLNREKEALIQQRIENQKQLERDSRELIQVAIDLSQTTITATASGIVSKLNLRNPGQSVRSGEEIAQIVPSHAPLVVKAAVLTSDIGKLKTGQKVQMRVSACPYPDYGTLKGVVSQVSKDTIKSQDASTSATTNTATENITFYEVTIQPESLVLGKGKNHCAIQLGMEGRADIISTEETLLQFWLRKARLLADF